MPHIAREFAKSNYDGLTFDSELYRHGLGFDEISSLVRRHRKESETLNACVFDVFIENQTDASFVARYDIVAQELPQVGCVKLVETYEVDSVEAVNSYFDEFLSLGFEGAVLRAGNHPYQHGKTNSVVKIKEFTDAEFRIIGFCEDTGKSAGCVKWKVVMDDGKTFNVVPNGSQAVRRRLFKIADQYIGALLKVRFCGYTGKGRPRFPVGLGIRDKNDL
jgi:DNA ligase-1